MEYEWKAMSEWLEDNKLTKRVPQDDGWEIYYGALRREKKSPKKRPLVVTYEFLIAILTALILLFITIHQV